MVAADVVARGSRRSSLTVVSGLLGLSTILTRLTMLAVMALLIRGAGTEAGGYFGLATLIASFTAAGLSVGLPTYLTRDVAAGLVRAPEVARIHLGRLAALLAAAAVCYPIAHALLPMPIQFGFVLFFAGSLFEQWNETAWVLVRGTGSAWREPVATASVGVLLVAACAVDAWLSDGLSFADAATYVAIASAVRAVAALLAARMPRHLRAPSGLRPAVHLRRALPYFASDLLGLLYFRGDVFVLAFFVTASQVGEYVSAAAIIGPAVQVAASMGVGALAYATPRVFAGRSAEDPATVVRFFRLAGQVASAGIFLALPLAVTVLFGGAGDRILRLAMILALFLALRFTNFGLSTVLLSRGHATSRLVVLVLSICGNVGLNLALDGRFGAYGAAWATVLTELIVAGSLLWFLRARELTRLAVISTAWVAVGVLMLVTALPALGTTPATMLTGAVMLTVAAGTLVRQARTARRPRTWDAGDVT